MKKTEIKMQEILSYLESYFSNYGYPPSIREICSNCNLKSTASAHEYLNRLERQGFLSKSPDKKRAYSLTEKNINTFAQAPLIGQVTAGQPILAVENLEGYYPLPPDFNNNDDMFYLQVKGESMIDAGIYNNDKILVKKQETADNGDIIVALIDDSVTVKRFYKKNNQIILHPENQTMSDMIFNDIQIIGKVVGLYRKF